MDKVDKVADGNTRTVYTVLKFQVVWIDGRDEGTALQKLTNRVVRPFPFPSLVVQISTGGCPPSPLIVHYEHVRT